MGRANGGGTIRKPKVLVADPVTPPSGSLAALEASLDLPKTATARSRSSTEPDMVSVKGGNAGSADVDMVSTPGGRKSTEPDMLPIEGSGKSAAPSMMAIEGGNKSAAPSMVPIEGGDKPAAPDMLPIKGNGKTAAPEMVPIKAGKAPADAQMVQGEAGRRPATEPEMTPIKGRGCQKAPEMVPVKAGRASSEARMVREKRRPRAAPDLIAEAARRKSSTATLTTAPTAKIKSSPPLARAAAPKKVVVSFVEALKSAADLQGMDLPVSQPEEMQISFATLTKALTVPLEDWERPYDRIIIKRLDVESDTQVHAARGGKQRRRGLFSALKRILTSDTCDGGAANFLIAPISANEGRVIPWRTFESLGAAGVNASQVAATAHFSDSRKQETWSVELIYGQPSPADVPIAPDTGAGLTTSGIIRVLIPLLGGLSTAIKADFSLSNGGA